MLYETDFLNVICSYIIWYIIQVYTAFNSSRTELVRIDFSTKMVSVLPESKVSVAIVDT